jgi:hypothetical protein
MKFILNKKINFVGLMPGLLCNSGRAARTYYRKPTSKMSKAVTPPFLTTAARPIDCNATSQDKTFHIYQFFPFRYFHE